MARSRILTTHTGSLPRPPAILERLLARERGEAVDGAELEGRLREAVVEVVRRQAEVGLDLVGDGELSKPSYATYVRDRLTGFAEGEDAPFPMPADLAGFPEHARTLLGTGALERIRRPACTGPVRYGDTGPVNRDLERFLAALEGVPHAGAFMTAASPGVIALFLPNRHYPTEDAYLEALGSAMRTEYQAIADAGLTLQLDAPDLAMGFHLAGAGDDLEAFRAKVRRRIEVLNRATEAIPPERMRLHVCWGNYAGPHHLDVALGDLLDLLLRARPAGLSFVAANPRHAHEWQVFREVTLPADKVLIPGVIDPTTPFIEHPEAVAERLVRFADLVGPERVVAGTDCGFGTFAGMGLDPALAWAKLGSLVEGARLAGARLPVRPDGAA